MLLFVSSAVQSGQRFAHDRTLRLAVPLQNPGVALGQHMRYKVVGNPTSAESRSERVSHVVDRKRKGRRLAAASFPVLTQSTGADWRRHPLEDELPRIAPTQNQQLS